MRVAAIAALVAAAWGLRGLRRTLIDDVTWWDAVPSEPPILPSTIGPPLPRAARTRVVVIDGLERETALALPAFAASCRRGRAYTIDVGFPTVSLPVEIALWSGLTQQQTGIVTRNGGSAGHYGRPLDPPLDRRGIPAQIADSIAIAEDHGWIVRSLGFAHSAPPAGDHPTVDRELDQWRSQWERAALAAVASSASLVFVHILRVDSVGHGQGIGPWYIKAAFDADRVLAQLVAADRDARWFVLSDHGHLERGGHGGEELAVRQVAGCVFGDGIAPTSAPQGLVHVVDIARAVAESTGAVLDPAALGRPLVGGALDDDDAVPRSPLGGGALATLLLALAIAATLWAARAAWLAPWWFAIAIVAVIIVRGQPTLSTPMTYQANGRDLYLAWLVALPVAALTSYAALARWSLARVAIAQLAVPALAAAAALALCGGWPVVFGGEQSPTVPRWTAWMLSLLLMVGHGAAAVALGALARLVRRAFGRPAPEAPPRSELANGE